LSVCFERELLILDPNVDKVVNACHTILKEIGLNVMKTESTKEGKTTFFAGEGILIPLLTKTLLYPLGLDDYVRSAQRSGIHIMISPRADGIHVIVCGIALDEVTAKLEEYTKDDLIEEVTDTLEAWDFEERFIKKILKNFPKSKELK
jgi:hypothetical protein